MYLLIVASGFSRFLCFIVVERRQMSLYQLTLLGLIIATESYSFKAKTSGEMDTPPRLRVTKKFGTPMHRVSEKSSCFEYICTSFIDEHGNFYYPASTDIDGTKKSQWVRGNPRRLYGRRVQISLSKIVSYT